MADKEGERRRVTFRARLVYQRKRSPGGRARNETTVRTQSKWVEKGRRAAGDCETQQQTQHTGDALRRRRSSALAAACAAAQAGRRRQRVCQPEQAEEAVRQQRHLSVARVLSVSLSLPVVPSAALQTLQQASQKLEVGGRSR